MKIFWFFLVLIASGNAFPDSIHQNKILVMSASNVKTSAAEKLKFDEISTFITERCKNRRFVRISIQKGEKWGSNGEDLDFLRKKIIDSAGLEGNQVFSAPGETSSAFLRRNDLWELTLKVKNPAVVEVFC
ncbi:hypothetical protein [Variovorax sp. PBS-H4]|uniref:hypothetical protein n=1 Tax=Variovorax sp. PBS-H4 TaxID=434008 RepID=UPI0013A52EF3|nr:hypothetical protein [Variovorax sp. PBS-H4]